MEEERKRLDCFLWGGGRDFPPRGDDPEIGELHDELITFDLHMAGILNGVLRRRETNLAELEFDLDLHRRIEAAARSDGPGASTAKLYLAYLNELEGAIRTAREIVARDKQQGEEPLDSNTASRKG